MSSHSNSDDVFKPPKELEGAWSAHPTIVKLGHPALRIRATSVARIGPETRKLVEQMVRTMREAYGLGLAAPQMGVSTRIIVYDIRDGDGLRVVVNPEIVSMKGEQLEPPEGCLSIPGLQGQVKRAMEVRVRGLDERGRKISIRATELEARVIQHEVDHLDGVLFIDRADPETLEWVFGSGEGGDGNAAPHE